MKPFTLLFLLSTTLTFAQEVEIEKDTVPLTQQPDSIISRSGKGKVITIESYARRFDPRKALLYSAVLPGMGQVYNKKYWKVPIVYGGFAGGVYLITFYQDTYDKYKSELFGILSDGVSTSPSGFTETQLRNIIRKARRERDFFTIMTGFWYILQLVDAHVDAHLKEFDLNPQLQISLEPTLQNSQMTGRTTGLSLTLKF